VLKRIISKIILSNFNAYRILSKSFYWKTY